MRDEHYYDYLKDLDIPEEEKEALRRKGEEAERKEREKSEDVYEYLEHLRIKRIAKNGIAIGLALVIVGAGYLALRHKGEQTTPRDPYSITEVDNTTTLTRYYTVEFNDTLSGIASETGIPMTRIQNDNDISNPNMINMNQRLVLNYQIEDEDLEYYTQTISIDGQNIADIANLYQTNIQTLTTLNPGNIVNNGNGSVTVLSDTIVVPNFITVNEYNSERQAQK